MDDTPARPGTVARRLAWEFLQRHPAEAAHLMNSLPLPEVLGLLQAVPVPVAAEIILQLNRDLGARAAQEMDEGGFRAVFTGMDPVRAALLLSRLDSETVRRRLALLPPGPARELEEVMAYPAETAGAMMDPRVTAFDGRTTVSQALESIRRLGRRRIVDICLVDEAGRLQALIPLQAVAVAEPDTPLDELAQPDPPRVAAMAPMEDVVDIMNRRRLASLPVVDIDERLLGIIRHDALVKAAQQDASEDVQAMFGAGRDERALSPMRLAVKKRLPWLHVNLLTAFLAAGVVGLFENTIAQITALAVFLPVVAGQSGNTGSQAMAVAMRGLALREIRLRHWLRLVRKEMGVGLINGAAVGLTTAAIVLFWTRSPALAAVILVSMVLSMVIAGSAGALTPLLLKAAGQDPATSSSIILTTITDVVGFFSFLGLATLFHAALVAG